MQQQAESSWATERMENALLRERISAWQLSLRGLLAGGLLLVLFGFNPNPGTDVLAHVAGFFAGGIFGGLLVFGPMNLPQAKWPNLCAELLCGGLVALTWWLALR